MSIKNVDTDRGVFVINIFQSILKSSISSEANDNTTTALSIHCCAGGFFQTRKEDSNAKHSIHSIFIQLSLLWMLRAAMLNQEVRVDQVLQTFRLFSSVLDW